MGNEGDIVNKIKEAIATLDEMKINTDGGRPVFMLAFGDVIRLFEKNEEIRSFIEAEIASDSHLGHTILELYKFKEERMTLTGEDGISPRTEYGKQRFHKLEINRAYENGATLVTQQTKEKLINGLLAVVPYLPDQKTEIPTKKEEKVSLKDFKIAYDEKLQEILVGKCPVKLPPSTNQSCLMRVLISHPPREYIDWSEVYQEMTGDDPVGFEGSPQGQKRKVYDAMVAINNRIKKGVKTNDKYLIWKNKSICRNY